MYKVFFMFVYDEHSYEVYSMVNESTCRIVMFQIFPGICNIICKPFYGMWTRPESCLHIRMNVYRSG